MYPEIYNITHYSHSIILGYRQCVLLSNVHFCAFAHLHSWVVANIVKYVVPAVEDALLVYDYY